MLALSNALKLNNHQLKLVGLHYGLKVRIRVDLTRLWLNLKVFRWIRLEVVL